MPTLTFETIKIGSEHLLADPEKADPDKIKTWKLELKNPTPNDEIEAAKTAIAQGLYAPNGATDRQAVLLSKGLTFAKRLITAWDRKDGEGNALAISPENIGTLPRAILREIGFACLSALPDDAEIEAAKK